MVQILYFNERNLISINSLYINDNIYFFKWKYLYDSEFVIFTNYYYNITIINTLLFNVFKHEDD